MSGHPSPVPTAVASSPRRRVKLSIDWCSHEAAVYACQRWHYSRKISNGKTVHVGVWEDDAFIGCVLFGMGANNNIGTRYRIDQTEVCELTRIALRSHATAVSRIVTIAIKFLRRQCPGLRLIVSYADPDQGHHGGIYQASNWLYVGSSEAQRQVIVGGIEMHKRSCSEAFGTASPAKIAQLTGKRASWGPMRWKHTYLMPLDDAMRAQVAPLRRPYPKRAKSDA